MGVDHAEAGVAYDEIFVGDSEMAALMRAHDWASTPLGPPQAWPQALKVALRLLLTSRFEMWLGWGPDVAFFYNDAYRPTLGIKHPNALAVPTRELWKEIWTDIEPRIRTVYEDGRATWDRALLLILHRSGYPEETYHTFSYSPLIGDTGKVEGLFCAVSEETERVISERRLGSLRELARGLATADTREAVFQVVEQRIGTNLYDLPFTLTYVFDDRDAARLACATGIPRGHPLAPETLKGGAADVWPGRRILSGEADILVALEHHAAGLPTGAWDRPPAAAMVLPLARQGADKPAGFMVAGLNPYRQPDADYIGFVGLIAGQIASSLANAEAYQAERRRAATLAEAVRLRQQAAEALRLANRQLTAEMEQRTAERDRLRGLFQQAPGFMCVLTGPDHVFNLANEAYLQLVGQRDLVGKAVREALPESEGQRFFDLLDQVYRTGEPFIGRALPLKIQADRDGPTEDRFVDFIYQPIMDATGQVDGIFVEGSDVTEGVLAVEALRARGEQFRAFAETMPNHVWAAQPGGERDWFNQQVYQYSGAAPGELDGESWGRIVHPDDLGPAAQAWMQAVRDGAIYETEFRIRSAGGSYRWFLVRAVPLRDEQGRVTRWIGTNTDVHDQRIATEQLARLNATLEQQVEERTRELDRLWRNSQDLLVVVGPDGYFRAVNPAWERILGFKPSEVVGQHVDDMIYHEDNRATLNALDHATRDVLAQFENRYRHKDGSFRWFSWTAAPDEHGVVYANGRHITAEKEARARLREAEEALRQSQKMEAVGQLTGGIAHDFNNLLTGVIGSLDMLRTRLSQGRLDAVDRYMNAATTSANRAAALTHRLLAFARRQPLDPKPVQANALVASLEDLLRRTVGETVALEIVLAGGLWPTLCDPNQLESSLLNLVINARDAMPDGGKLTIETCNAHLDDAYVAARRDVVPGQYVCICVTDTGTGMSPDIIKQAFDPFFTTKPIGQGTGLGLSMVYGFARQSEGHAKIYSEVGVGTTVKIYLPRYRGETDAEVEAATLAEAPRAESGETVLVVEDEPVVRSLIVEVLQDLGYRALEAGDGPAGLKILQSKKRIDLLVSDVGLPGMNGRQLADAAREKRPQLKVLFITGYAENATLAAGFLEPGMQMITKPFAVDAIAQKIRSILSGG